MNDLTPQPSAARLSEDIGDVLSAIRRLIAEDEALSTAREHREEERIAHFAAQPAVRTAGGDVLAERYGGNAALARRMALGMGPRRPQAVEPVDGESGTDVAARRHADEAINALTAPEPHPFEAVIGAMADEAIEDDAAGFFALTNDDGPDALDTPRGDAMSDDHPGTEAVDLAGEAREVPVLRLQDSDRVISLSGASGSETSAEWNRILPWRAWTPPQVAAPTLMPTAVFIPDTVPVEPVLVASPTVMIVEDDDLADDGADETCGQAPEMQAVWDDVPVTGEGATAEAEETEAEAQIAVVVAPEAEAAGPKAVLSVYEDADVPVTVDMAEPAAAADAALTAGPETILDPPEAAAPMQTDVAAPAPHPVPTAVLRPRASRWARIEPPVTRQRVAGVMRAITLAAPMGVEAEPKMAEVAPSVAPALASESEGAIPLAVRLARSLRGERISPAAPIAACEPAFVAEDQPAQIICAQEASASIPAELAEAEAVQDEGPLEVQEGEPALSQAVTAEADEVAVDEAAPSSADQEAHLRALVRSAIQDELLGELGHRFARNLRAVIRREVATALDGQLDRL